MIAFYKYFFVVLLALAALMGPGVARADDPPAPQGPPQAPTADTVEKARSEFLAGATFVQNAQWGEALAAFERSAALRPHSLTTYNVGACERALGRYTRARAALRAALTENERAGGKELPVTFGDEAKSYLAEIAKLLAHADVTVLPEDATLAVDGRPLGTSTEPVADGTPLVVVAGTLAPGPGTSIARARFELDLDPGAHVLTLSRRGYADVVLNRTFLPGSRTELKLVLDKLPALIRVRAERDGAVVKVDDSDVGVAPVDVSRPAGSYAVVVSKPSFDTYRTRVEVRAGEVADLVAPLPPERVPLTKRWWFWTAAGVVLVGAAISVYFIAQPAPDRPAADGGGFGWVAKVPAQ